MARVFANDVLRECEKQGIHSKFEMVILAAHRAKQIPKVKQSDHILSGEEYDQGSTAVTALREIEEGKYTQAHYFGTEKVEGLKEETTEEEQDEYQLTQSERNPE